VTPTEDRSYRLSTDKIAVTSLAKVKLSTTWTKSEQNQQPKGKGASSKAKDKATFRSTKTQQDAPLSDSSD